MFKELPVKGVVLRLDVLLFLKFRLIIILKSYSWNLAVAGLLCYFAIIKGI